MGNGASKNPNQGRATIKFEMYEQRGSVNIPKKMKDRISPLMWREFTNIANQAASTPDSAKCKKNECIAMGLFFGGFFGGLCGGGAIAGAGGGVCGANGNWGCAIPCILLGAIMFFGGIFSFFYSSIKMQTTQQGFYRDVCNALDTLLQPLNTKYNGMIFFKVYIPNQPTGGNRPNIHVDFELKVQKVEHIPNYGGPVMQQPVQQQVMMPQQQIIQQPSGVMPQQIIQQPVPQQQVVMVQMADGRMVPAQIVGPAAAQPQVVQQIHQQPQYIPQQQPPQQMQVHHGMNQYNPNAAPPPAYNPNVNDVVEEQQEGGTTNGPPVYN